MRNILFAAVAALILPLFVGTFIPAQADTPGCVTAKEYRAAKTGMTPRRVGRIFDTTGEPLDGGAGGYTQGYQRCSGGGIIVGFGWIADSDKVGLYSKMQTNKAVVSCVTTDEWRQVYINPDGSGSGPGDGGTLHRVHRVFGTKGWVVDRFNTGDDQRWQIRKYQRCNSAMTRKVSYTKVGASAWWSYWG